jgi:integrase
MKGSMRQRSPGSWELRFDTVDAKGNRKQRSATFRGGKREAQAELNRLLAELQSGAFVEPAKLTVGEYLEKWLAHVKTRVKPNSFALYSVACRRHILPALGAVPVQKLTTLQVQELLDGLRANGRAAKTIHAYRVVLSTALKQAVSWGVLPRNPCDGAPGPRLERKDPAVLDANGARRLLETAEGSWLGLPVLLALSTGLRRGEVLGLKWDDIDLGRGTLQVKRQRTGDGKIAPPKTDRAARTLRLPVLASEALKSEREIHSLRRLELGSLYCRDGWIVCKEDGTPYHPTTLTDAFKELAKSAGFPGLTFHGLRHTSATLAISGGADVRTVAGRLGHTSAALTLSIYAHFLEAADEGAAAALDSLLRPGAGR